MDIYGILGYPIRHSLSPILHNTAFKKLGIKAKYLKFSVAEGKLDNFFRYDLSKKKIKGLSITSPYKISCIKYLSSLTKNAKKIGAVNTIKITNKGKIIGENFDWIGILKAIQEKISLKNKKIVLLGAGGAGRAAIYGLLKAKVASITVFLRNLDKYTTLEKEFPIKMDKIENLKKYPADILINATNVGMKQSKKQRLVPKEYLKKGMVVFDFVYSPLNTKLIKEAKKQGCIIITGEKMLFYQALEQFKFWTNLLPPVPEMYKKLIKNLK